MLIRDNPEARGRGQGEQALHRLLDHGLLAIKRQKLLGAALTAERPEAGAAAAGKNHGMEISFQPRMMLSQFQIEDCRFQNENPNLAKSAI